uniref:(California timema) hypothetical protein n=1 Tax=Timema californicum TaxID=61474 RepID=A0A7R9J5E7_TIMCA|nr:unnamed protein product [Timema californicum]
MHQPSRKIAINNAGYSCLPSRAKLDLVPGSTHNLSNLGIHSMNPHQHLPGNTSPTSDQLARWFSPELLAQARAGNLPDMPPVPSSSNMLSLEELERLQQASAAVHN